MISYLDSSVVGRSVGTDEPSALRWNEWTTAFTSDLTRVEVRRMLYRLRFTGDVTEAGLRARLSRFAALERTWEYVELTRQLLRLAALPTITPVKALDAIHIASAIILRDQLGEPITFATHDRQQAAAARTLGFEVVGV